MAKDMQDGRKRPYHHGDLRTALLAAAELELSERGVEGFTLRGCAKRAGVSHAAPAHHFKDANALLTALACEGFSRFVTAMETRQAAEPDEPVAQLLAAGLGYIDFARGNPALFRLMFASDRPDSEDPALKAMASRSFDMLLGAVARINADRGADPQETLADVAAAWSMVHGIANLMLAGEFPAPADMPWEAEEKLLRNIIMRIMPSAP